MKKILLQALLTAYVLWAVAVLYYFSRISPDPWRTEYSVMLRNGAQHVKAYGTQAEIAEMRKIFDKPDPSLEPDPTVELSKKGKLEPCLLSLFLPLIPISVWRLTGGLLRAIR